MRVRREEASSAPATATVGFTVRASAWTPGRGWGVPGAWFSVSVLDDGGEPTVNVKYTGFENEKTVERALLRWRRPSAPAMWHALLTKGDKCEFKWDDGGHYEVEVIKVSGKGASKKIHVKYAAADGYIEREDVPRLPPPVDVRRRPVALRARGTAVPPVGGPRWPAG